MRPLPSFATLFDTHRALLHGRFLAGADALGESGDLYVWSADIPDPTMNFVVAGEALSGAPTPAADLDRLIEAAPAAAARRDRAPAVLAFPPEGWTAPPRVEHRYGALWMVLDDAPAPVFSALRLSEAAHPGADFAAPFAEAHPDAAIADHVRRHYVAPLGRPPAKPGVRDLHLVGRDGDGAPVACATVMVRGEIAGLYNVAVCHDRQGRGYGATIAAAAARRALEMGAGAVFLQCPDGGPVERLYARLGFRRAYVPSLLCLSSG